MYPLFGIYFKIKKFIFNIKNLFLSHIMSLKNMKYYDKVLNRGPSP